MSAWDLLLPGQDRGGSSPSVDRGGRKPVPARSRGWCSSGRNLQGEPISPDTWTIKEGDDVYSWHGGDTGNGFVPLAWRVTKLHSPAEATALWPNEFPSSLDKAPFTYPVIELDDNRITDSASHWMLKPTRDRLYRQFL